MEANLKAVLRQYNQEHLLNFWNIISEQEQAQFAEEILNLDLNEVTLYFNKASSSLNVNEKLLDEKIRPIPENLLESIRTCSSKKLCEYEDLGLREISDNKVAVLLMAGGQGTRLGVSYPKGMYNVGLPSGRTLFHLQALRIQRIQNLARERFGKNGEITWYILTSEATNEQTQVYFERNKYFGLRKENVVFFKQGMLPCFSFDGKIILDEKHRISTAPDGNGGVYRALKKQGITDDMVRRGLRSVHVHSVDNILVKVADPIFLGYCISKKADCGVKVVPKRSSDEPVGVVCQVDNQYRVVEYSEVTPKTSQLRNSNGDLVFNAGNICNHYFTVDFLQDICHEYETEMDLHVAKKKIPYIDRNGMKQVPDTPNGIKVEKFVFDVFKFSKSFAVWEVIREHEFSAVKNSDKSRIDCPSTAMKDVLALHKKWLLEAGAKSVDGDVEICPLVSYAGENLTGLCNGQSLHGPICMSKL